MDVARLNMSHGNHDDHRLSYDIVRPASDATGHGVGIIADLQGPKIRLETFADGKVEARQGRRVRDHDPRRRGRRHDLRYDVQGAAGRRLGGRPDPGRRRQAPAPRGEGRRHRRHHAGRGRRQGQRPQGPQPARRRGQRPGPVGEGHRDLRWALRTSVDFIALSFVRSAADVDDVREIMREEGVMLPVIAKIEKPQAIDNLDEVVEAFDAFMVARGDLGVECPLEDVPFLQKRVIDKARRNAKPVIVATQMLESMITNPAADPRRGLRRRERGPRRRRRGDALRRDQRGGVPDRDRRDDGPDRRLHRGPRAGQHGRDRLAAAHPRRRDRQGRRRGRRARRREVPRRLHPVR